jgi:uncharacterized membrane protein YciS (DUF1049 family)
MFVFLKSVIRIVRSVVIVGLLGYLIIFMINNRAPIEIYFYPLSFSIKTRVFLAIITFFILGILCGFALCSQNFIRHFIKNFADGRKIKKLKKEIASKNPVVNSGKSNFFRHYFSANSR